MRKRVIKTAIVFSLILLLCLSGVTAWAGVTPPAGPQQIVLSLTGEPTEMAVSWCDGVSSGVSKASGGETVSNGGAASDDVAVYYRIQEDTDVFQIAEVKKTVAGDGYQYYEAVMKGLTPGQAYSYKVVTPTGESDLRGFSAAADLDSTDDFEFLYLGDVQTKASSSMAADFDGWSELVKSAVERNPETAFLLQGGDLVNQGSDPEEWQALLTRGEATLSTVPFLSVPGNHEANGDTTGKPELWSGIFNLPKNGPDGFSEEFYSFDYGDSHILCLNSNVLSDEQLNLGSMTAADFDRIKSWIINDLSNSDKTWKIVVLHHPAYSVVSDPVAEQVLGEWAPIFEDYNVSLVFCGHQHVYMRTKAMFDRDVSTKSGITYIMGNSGSKFYSTVDQNYAAKMLGNVSTYQRVRVSSEGIAVTTFDAAGTELDRALIPPRISEVRKITLSYGAANATVAAPESAIPGAFVTVNVSNLAAGKSVYDVAVKDKNGKAYAVTAVTKNSAYTFSMPNRSVTVEVLFEDAAAGGSDGKAYEVNTDNGGDPIWNITVASSGLEDNKIKSGSTVFVTVTRENEAISAALKGIRITSGTTEVTASAEGTVSDKKGKYKFIMPTGAVRIQVEAEYKPFKIYVRETKNDAYVLKKTLDRDAMPASAGTAYYSGYDRYPTAVIGKATEFVTLKELLKEYGIELTEESTIALGAIDGATSEFTYSQLYGEKRYYFPNIGSGSSDGKKAVEPILVTKGYQTRLMNLERGKTIEDMASDTLCAYRFAYGQTTEEFNDGTPSTKYATVGNFLKWTNAIRITGYKAVSEVEVPVPGGGGGGIAVDTTPVLGADGKASVKPELSAVKESLSKAQEASGSGNSVPRVNIDIPLQEGMTSVAVTLTKEVLTELASAQRLRMTVSTPFGSTIFDADALKSLKTETGDKGVVLSIAPLEKGRIKSSDGRQLTGENAEITLTAGSHQITTLGGEKITIRLPFTADAAKKINGYYVVWLSEDGKGQRMAGAAFNTAAKAMEFETDHLSVFAIAYTENTAVNQFTDVAETAWYAPYATFVTENGSFQGISETAFGPDVTMTRGMLVTVLGRAANVSISNYSGASFNDVSSVKWYGGYVQWAYENKIVTGVGAGKFAPDQAVTREQLAVILKNYTSWKEKSASSTKDSTKQTQGSNYGDQTKIATWAKDAVKFTGDNGWLTGYPDGEFKPEKSATRAEVAKVLAGVMNQ